MSINITVDEKLIEEAVRLTGENDRIKLVERALSELIRKRSKLEGLLALAGKIEFYDGYDPKKLRMTRHDLP